VAVKATPRALRHCTPVCCDSRWRTCREARAAGRRGTSGGGVGRQNATAQPPLCFATWAPPASPSGCPLHASSQHPLHTSRPTLDTISVRPRRLIVLQNSGFAVISRQRARTMAERHRSSRHRWPKMSLIRSWFVSTCSLAESPSSKPAAASSSRPAGERAGGRVLRNSGGGGGGDAGHPGCAARPLRLPPGQGACGGLCRATRSPVRARERVQRQQETRRSSGTGPAA
jgi:hypothetical protein